MKVVPWLMIMSTRLVGGCTGTLPIFFFFFFDSQVSLTSFTHTQQQHDSHDEHPAFSRIKTSGVIHFLNAQNIPVSSAEIRSVW